MGDFRNIRILALHLVCILVKPDVKDLKNVVTKWPPQNLDVANQNSLKNVVKMI